MPPTPELTTPSGHHKILVDPVCTQDGQTPCPPPGSRVADRSWVYERIAIVSVVLVGVFTFIGGVTYAQSKDAGMAASRDAAAVAVEALAKVNALTLVVAQNEALRKDDVKAAKDDAREQAADIKALSTQIKTGVQPERLKPDKDGGP